MAKNGNIHILNPEMEFDLPFKRDKEGNYIIIPRKRRYSGITSVNKNKNPNGYLYFIKSKGFDFYKLGVSSNPVRRINDIDSYMPFDIDILSIHFFDDVYSIEKMLSEKLEKFNVRREWYQLDVDTASSIMIELHNLNVERYVCGTKRK